MTTLGLSVTAKVRYCVRCQTSPLCSKQAWVLVRDTMIGDRVLDSVAVALFNFDLEAETFQRFLLAGGTIEVDKDLYELVTEQAKRNHGH